LRRKPQRSKKTKNRILEQRRIRNPSFRFYERKMKRGKWKKDFRFLSIYIITCDENKQFRAD